MIHDFKYGIPIVVLLALVIAIASDYCRPFPPFDKVATISIPSPFNPVCFVASFEPEAPELNTYDIRGNLLSSMSNSAIGTANVTVSGYRI